MKLVKRNKIYTDPWVTLFQDDTELADGTHDSYAVFERKNGCGAVAITEKNEVILVNQFRYPIQDFQWNIPGGGIDEGESIEEAVRRELKEETGAVISSLEQLPGMFPLSSCSTEHVDMFFARVSSIEPVTFSENTEQIREVRAVPMAEALRMIDAGEISDPMTTSAIQMVARKLQKEKMSE